LAFAIPIGAALLGQRLLDLLAVSLPAFRIAGGLLLFSIASEMVYGLRIPREARAAEQALKEHARNVAAFPLVIPLMAGPGANTATLLLAGRAQGDALRLALLMGAIAAIMALCFGVFLAATRVERLLGASGSLVLSKLLGVLLAALVVQFVADGVRALLSGLAESAHPAANGPHWTRFSASRNRA
jgi:multiple antibiotic resistance protein